MDGFKLGAMLQCSPPVGADAATLDNSCVGNLKRATAALDARDSGHAAIVSVRTYADGAQAGAIDVTGDASPPTAVSPGPGPVVTVVVFTLADGSTNATGVACPEKGSCVGIASHP